MKLKSSVPSGFWVGIGGGGSVSKEEMYSGIIFKCIDIISENVASNGYRLVQKSDKGDKRIFTHPILDLLKKPNPTTQSGNDLLKIMSGHIDIYGKTYLYKVRGGLTGKIRELWVLNPAIMRVDRENGVPIRYNYGRTTYTAEEVSEIVRPDPMAPNSFNGLSTIGKARRDIEGSIQSSKWNLAFMNNGAVPSGTLSTDQTLNDDAFDRLKKQFMKENTGVDNIGKPLVLEGGLKWMSNGITQKDMDYVKQKEFSRDEILAIFGVPKGILYANDVNRANAEAAKYFFAEHTLDPRVRFLFEKLDAILTSEYDKTGRLELQPNDPVPENVELLLKRKETGVNKWLTVNEVRAEDGYEPLEGGDILYIPANNMPVGADTDPSKPSKQLISKANIDRKFKQQRDEYLAKKEEELKFKLKVHFNYLIRKTRAKKESVEQSAEIIVNEATPNMDEWRRDLAAILFIFGYDTYLAAMAALKETYGIEGNTNLEQSGATSQIKLWASNAAASVTETTIEKARTVVQQLLDQGNVSIEAAKVAIADAIGIEADWRAERIARTELVRAYSEASSATYKASELVKRVKWITSDPCPICQQNNNQIVDKGGVFNSGHTETPAHPNCKCEIVPVFN